jgi:hypothetical protein
LLGPACGGEIETVDDSVTAANQPAPALPVRGPGNDAPAPAPAPSPDPASASEDPVDAFTTDVTRTSDAGTDASPLL